MAHNVIEYWRQEIVSDLFKLSGFEDKWPEWQRQLKKHMTPYSWQKVFNGGDYLYDIFKSTGSSGRAQDSLSISGHAWEALVCWYLNLNLINRNTIVTTRKQPYVPTPVSDALTVTHGVFKSNTESDLIAITFPKSPNALLDIEYDKIVIKDASGKDVVLHSGRSNRYNLKGVIDALANALFDKIEIHVIQCKTNWNDNAQIPMLWDMIYSSAKIFNSSGSNISVGQNGRSLADVAKFSYSFATVPTVDHNRIKTDSACVRRVASLTGGNYWGRQTVSGIAQNIKEMLTRNLSNGHRDSLQRTLGAAVSQSNFSTTYGYFQL